MSKYILIVKAPPTPTALIRGNAVAFPAADKKYWMKYFPAMTSVRLQGMTSVKVVNGDMIARVYIIQLACAIRIEAAGCDHQACCAEKHHCRRDGQSSELVLQAPAVHHQGARSEKEKTTQSTVKAILRYPPAATFDNIPLYRHVGPFTTESRTAN
jgi:hypothetical protein